MHTGFVDRGTQIAHRSLRLLCAGLLILALAACDGGGGGAAPPPSASASTPGASGSAPATATYQISGTLTGLSAGASVVLSVNGQALALSQNGGFTTAARLPTGTPYAVTVAIQPTDELCVVNNGTGVIGTSNIINVAVACTAKPTATYTIGGTVSGLSGTLQLLDNQTDAVTVSSNGPFTFSHPLFDQAAYDVTVWTQPAGQTCTVTNGAGTVQGANVTSVQVSCITSTPPPPPPPPATYTLGGTVSGLSGTVVLSAGTQSVTVTANGSFTFPTALTSGTSYAVQVQTQPTGQTCAVANGVGTVGSSNVTNVTVTCAANTYSIGGTLSGLTSGARIAVVLQDNGGDNLTLTNNGTFTFANQIASGGAYNVTVLTQPTGQTCTVTHGTGTVGTGTVTSVQVACQAVQTVSFTTPGAATWTVPAGVTSIQIVATGGAGGGDGYAYGTGYGGNGAVVTATLAVTPGQVLQLFVGGGGAIGGGSGLPAGSQHYGGGSGGGATSVDAGQADQIIAGGGGGGYSDNIGGSTGGGSGCANGFAGGDGNGTFPVGISPAAGGNGGIGGTGSLGTPYALSGNAGGNGDGGAGGLGGPQLFVGGAGAGSGAGTGGDGGLDTTTATPFPIYGAGGGGGYGGGGGGNGAWGGGGAGGSVGPTGSTCVPGSNGGTLYTGGNGSIVFTYY